MDRGWLERELLGGTSIEAIARASGRHPSSVSYWVHKHGLRSSLREKHSARGPLARELLEPLVQRGLSVRAIAAEVDRSTATVRHWLGRHGLSTARSQRQELVRESLAQGEDRLTATCPRHGSTAFVRRSAGGVRCLACRSEAVVARRRRVKQLLLEDAGGRCAICGYDRTPAALQFHHLDPGEKEFALSRHGVTRSIARARTEAAKCVLLCANCHAEVEVGAATIPSAAPEVEPPG